jgi:4-hydroxy-2-oxoglutarate aldolase
MLEGIFPPLPTPFQRDGALDLGLLRDLVSRLDPTGLAGYVALGSNGEAVHLDPHEADAVVRCVRESAAPGMRVIAGTGRPSTRATIEATRRAADAGAGAALVITPSYYKAATTADALRRHFEAVADASPIPIVLYNVPANTGFNCPVEIVASLAPHPNVVGIKDSAGDAAQLAALVAATRRPFEVLSGNFGTLLSGLEAGAVGGILAVANVMPEACVEILRLQREGRNEEAAALHARVLPVARAVTSRWGVPGLKAAMELRGVPCGVPRGPLLPLDASERRELQSVLEGAQARRAGISSPASSATEA